MTTDPLIGHQTSELRFDRLIGRGAMGSVYQGIQLSLGRTVAIKVIAAHLAEDADHRTRFDREARTLGRLVHPNIIACHDVGPCPGPDGEELFVMVLEFVDGWNLGALLKKDQLTVRRVLDLHRQAAEGLAYAHSEGIIHRDIKPDNIMVTKQGQAKVADFGLAKGEDSTLVTHTGVILGSPAYMSPEACQGQALSPMSDLYGFGCSLFHCLSGSPPFPASSSLQVLNLHVNAPVPLLSSRRPDLAMLDQVLLKLLAKDPKDRYQSGAIVARDLKELIPLIPGRSQAGHGQIASMVAPTMLSGLPSGVSGAASHSPTATIATATPPASPRRWPWIAAALVLAAVALMVIDAGRAPGDHPAARQGGAKDPFQKPLDEAEQNIRDHHLDTAEALLNNTYNEQDWPAGLQPRVKELKLQLITAWDEQQRNITRGLDDLRRLIRDKHVDKARIKARELAQLTTPERFAVFRADIDKEVAGLQGAAAAGPRILILQEPLPMLGYRPGEGAAEIPAYIPGFQGFAGSSAIFISSTENKLQRIAYACPDPAPSEGVALVIQGGIERDLRVANVVNGQSQLLASVHLTGGQWDALVLPFKSATHLERLVLEADGDRPFAVGRVLLGYGGVPKVADLHVVAGTLRPLAWTPFYWHGVLRRPLQAQRVVLGVVGEKPPSDGATCLLAQIDRIISPGEGDNLKTDGRVLQLKPTTDPKEWVKADQVQLLFLELPAFQSKENAEYWGRRISSMLPMQLKPFNLRSDCVLPIPIIRSEGPSQSEAFAKFLPGEVPIIDLDQVASFERRCHLLGPEGKATTTDQRAGLLAGVAELHMRFNHMVKRWMEAKAEHEKESPLRNRLNRPAPPP